MPKRILLEQGSDEWLEFRKGRIGCSSLAAVMGRSPWSTPYQAWLEITGRVKKEMNEHMRRGHELEPIARSLAERAFSLELKPDVFVHDKFDHFMASLDGFDRGLNIIWENKAPMSIATHNSTCSKPLPDHYYIQVQGQLLISGADKCLFTTIVDKGYRDYEINHQWVKPDKEMFEKIEAAVDDFRRYIEGDFAPPTTNEDDNDLRIDEEWKLATFDYKYAKAQYDKAKIDLEVATDRLKSIMKSDRECGYGVTATRYAKRGAVDYTKVKELNGVDLSKYRKPDSTQVRITINKE